MNLRSWARLKRNFAWKPFVSFWIIAVANLEGKFWEGMALDKSETEDVSTAKAVLVGALAPGVNVGKLFPKTVFCLYSWILILPFHQVFPIKAILFSFGWFGYYLIGSNLEYSENGVSYAGSLSCYHAGLSILIQWSYIDTPYYIPRFNLRDFVLPFKQVRWSCF